ncbi:MAG TPA: nitrophenyl compound nitroreductase subunit ArsF family protein [Candidatus Polarisedimenticolaceae bacterium]
MTLVALALAAAAATTPAPEHAVRVYYFYTTQRCASCRKIEAWTDEAVHAAWPEAVDSSAIEWVPLNLDEPANRHFVSDYRLFTKSVVVVELRNGEQVRWKNLPRIWELLMDRDAFRRYVRREVAAYLEAEP